MVEYPEEIIKVLLDEKYAWLEIHVDNELKVLSVPRKHEL